MAGDTSLRAEIDKYTQGGTDHLQQGHLDKALDAYKHAYNKSIQLNDDHTERTCAFNYGAVYIALQKPHKGLSLLQRAIPPSNQRDGKSNGDLYFNFGLAYEYLQNIEEAAKYYELALEEYQNEGDNFQMEADISIKLGSIYKHMRSPLQSARTYGIAAEALCHADNLEQQTLAMCQQALQLLIAGRKDDAVEISDDCMVLCQKVSQGDVLGRLYNELGLIYTQTTEYGKAATCFELALPLSRGPKGDMRRQAVILQNLGAVYNSLSDYQRALSFHENAASLHAELNNRNSQGQCFANLAYAYSQIGEHDSAGECYLHALQAAKDTGDQHAQWQAMEGLGAVSFNEGNVKRAVKYFKSALSTLSNSEKNIAAQERLVAKLTDALQCQLGHGSKKPKGRTVPIDAIEVSEAEEVKSSPKQEQVELPDTRTTAESATETDEYSQQDLNDGGFSKKKADQNQSRSRRHKKPLLRSDTFDSEYEWREKMREVTSDSDIEYRERLRPPSTPALEQYYQRESKRKPKSNRRKPKTYDPDSDQELTDRLNRLRGREVEEERPRSNRQRPKSGRPPRRDERDEVTDTESEGDDVYQVEQAMRQFSNTDTPPPLPEHSPRATINMSGTYEKPVQETVTPPSANYFKPQQPTVDEDEPIYETIKLKTQTLHPEEEIPGPSGYHNQVSIDGPPPPVPPKTASHDHMTRAERERFLYEKHQQMNEEKYHNENVNLPNGKKNEPSKSCIVM